MNEKRFLYPITVDSVIFGYANKELHVALIEREREPFKGMWAIPGGFMEGEETAEETARRELQEETGISNLFLQQFHVFTSHGRDPRGRTITIGFFALVDPINYKLISSEDALQAKWWPAYAIPKLAFGQEEIYKKALEALQLEIKTKPLAFQLLPKEFTLTDLQSLYESIFNIHIDKRNFRRKIGKMEFIVPLGKKEIGTRHRPAELFTFNEEIYKMHAKENFI